MRFYLVMTPKAWLIAILVVPIAVILGVEYAIIWLFILWKYAVAVVIAALTIRFGLRALRRSRIPAAPRHVTSLH